MVTGGLRGQWIPEMLPRVNVRAQGPMGGRRGAVSRSVVGGPGVCVW